MNFFSLAVWLHVFAGVIWIGLLYYFNFVQVPALADAASDSGGPGGAGISKYVAPRALLWFRWGALATWLTGAWALMYVGGFSTNFFATNGVTVIGIEGIVVRIHRQFPNPLHDIDHLGEHRFLMLEACVGEIRIALVLVVDTDQVIELDHPCRRRRIVTRCQLLLARRQL